jgi:hypothetical protein
LGEVTLTELAVTAAAAAAALELAGHCCLLQVLLLRPFLQSQACSLPQQQLHLLPVLLLLLLQHLSWLPRHLASPALAFRLLLQRQQRVRP